MSFLLDLTIVTRLRIAYGLFLLPVAFLFFVIFSDTARQISSSRQEVAGVEYIRVLFGVYDTLARDGGASHAGLAASVEDAERRLGEGMNTAGGAASLAMQLRAGPVPEAMTRVIAFVGKVTDGSGLTLDTDLDSFYVMDAVTGKIPGLIDALIELSAMNRSFQSEADLTPDEQAKVLLIEGRARGFGDGLKASLETAFKANRTGATAAALRGGLISAHDRAVSALKDLNTAAMRVPRDRPGAAQAGGMAVGELARLRDAAAQELLRLLEQRIAGARGQLMLNIGIALALFGLSVAFIAVAVEAGGIRPLTRMTAAMRRLAEGDLNTDVSGTGRRDEIGRMAMAMAVFRDNAIKARDLSDEAERVRRAKDRRQAAMDLHVQDFGASSAGVMAGLTRDATTMRERAAETSDVVRQTRALAARTASGATESARNLAQVAAAAEQMSASINEIGAQVGRVTNAVQTSVERATETDTKVAGLAEAAEHVESVVRLITDIAARTNLLALNATIEAARAGDAGKGFAVVAGEVKALASQTAKATEEIGMQIVAIRTATSDAVNAVRDVSSAIEEVSAVASAIAAAVEEQSTVTATIAASVTTVAAATEHATQAMREVSAMSDTAEDASAAVLTASDHVSETSRTLHRELTQFLSAIAVSTEEERRRFERISGNGQVGTLTLRGGRAMPVPIVDISMGGIAVKCDLRAEAGTEGTIILPGIQGAADGRVARTAANLLALSFRQDPANLARVEQALRVFGDARGERAA